MAGDWLTAREATAVLGVKPETLYAYVSRGLVGRERDPGARTSRYARADVERLAERQRRPERDGGGLEVAIETGLTLVDPAGGLAYRGWSVVDAVDAGFEAVAHWLWTGERPANEADVELPTPSTVEGVEGVHGIDVLLAAVAAARARHAPHSDDRRAGAVAETGRTILATMLAALAEQQRPRRAARDTVAARLWPRLTARPPRLRDIDALDAALVLLADHELAASTLAARVVAGTGADPYLVVLAGLAAIGGPLHGGGAEQVRALLHEVDAGATADAAIERRLARGERVPGFGHRVYRVRDPRADHLLARLDPLAPAASDVLDAARRLRLPFANVDFAVAAFAEAAGMVDGAGETIVAVARTAGWLAHAIEEYERPQHFRPRAVYVGPGPAS
jgi:citrate synthase